MGKTWNFLWSGAGEGREKGIPPDLERLHRIEVQEVLLSPKG